MVTAAVVLLTVTLATLAGYAFARMRFPGSSILFYTLLLGLTLPAEAFIIRCISTCAPSDSPTPIGH